MISPEMNVEEKHVQNNWKSDEAERARRKMFSRVGEGSIKVSKNIP